ncbi:MAG: ATP-binding protein [Actinophytocola sp.]|uniref:ATP-binding protein n=1 Tax=Actinophytocola sp. TaxID=1872138 RepID=UPI003D6BF727
MTGTSSGRIADFRYRGDASIDQLSSLRRDLIDWSRRAGLAQEQVQAVALAGYEALANAVEHAFPDRPDGVIELHATMGVERLTVTVTDWGRWREPPADPGVRGRGLVLIRNLCTNAEIVATDAGTTVTMNWDLEV